MTRHAAVAYRLPGSGISHQLVSQISASANDAAAWLGANLTQHSTGHG
jgi:hypothetical protein